MPTKPLQGPFSYQWPAPLNHTVLRYFWRPINPATYGASDIPLPILAKQTATIPVPRQIANNTDYAVQRRPQDPSTSLIGSPFTLVNQSRGPSQLPLQPFGPTIWPAPIRLPPSFSWVEQAIMTVQPAPFSTPFAQYSWPNPIAVQWRPWAQNETLLPVLNAPAVVVANYPTAPIAWPLPKPAVPPVPPTANALGSPMSLIQPQPAAVAAQPFAQANWPVPRSLPGTLQTWSTSNLALYAYNTPFNQADWPLPKQLQWRQAFQQPNITVGFPTAPVVFLTPFNQIQWPNPIQFPQVRQDRNWQNADNTIALQQSIVGPTVTPFARYNWPVPRGAAHPTSNRTWIGSTFALLNPQPAGAAPPISAREFTQIQRGVQWRQQYVHQQRAHRLPPFTSGPIPFKQSSWPLPIPAVPAIALRTWANNGIELRFPTPIPPPIPPIPPPPVINYVRATLDAYYGTMFAEAVIQGKGDFTERSGRAKKEAAD